MLLQVGLAARDGLAPESFGLRSIAAFESQIGQVAKAMADRLAASGPISFQLLIHFQRPPVLRVGFVSALGSLD